MSLTRNQVAAARRLLLVAYLLSSSGKSRGEAEIRANLPPYLNIYDSSLRANGGDEEVASDALRKQLGRDVDALSNVGISASIEVEGRSGGRRYSLASEVFSPVEVELDAEERAVLVGALRSLRRDFPYLGPLKLAIANLIGAASEGDSPQNTATFAAVATRDDERVSSRLGVLERAILRKRRVRFEYYAINSNETAERELEPYALSLLEGIWYVTGRDTNREDIRQFRISRVLGRITFATKKDFGDFEAPEDFERSIVGPRAPWQLSETRSGATVLVSEGVFQATLNRYGFAFSVGESDGRGRELSTSYSGERQLAAWLLSLGEEAEAISPEPLIGRVKDGLQRILDAHSTETGLPDSISSESRVKG